jgi:hypothetical protein
MEPWPAAPRTPYQGGVSPANTRPPESRMTRPHSLSSIYGLSRIRSRVDKELKGWDYGTHILVGLCTRGMLESSDKLPRRGWRYLRPASPAPCPLRIWKGIQNLLVASHPRHCCFDISFISGSTRSTRSTQRPSWQLLPNKRLSLLLPVCSRIIMVYHSPRTSKLRH